MAAKIYERRAHWAHKAPAIFDRTWSQWLYRFRKSGDWVSERVQGLALEYRLDTAIGWNIFLHGSFEDVEIEHVSDALRNRPGPVILDIGANIGWHALRWATRLRHATVYAFEPSRATSDVLQRNVRRNGLGDRVHVLTQAVSEQEGKAQFFECRDDAFSSLKDTQRSPVTGTTTVDVTTIDAFVASAGLSRVDAIKIDVEGFESSVLAGARETLRTRNPLLLVEIFKGTNSNTDPERTVALMLSLGYRAQVFVRGELQPYEKHNDDFYNYFFTRG